MALDTGTLIIELKTRGVKLTKAQLKQLDQQTEDTTKKTNTLAKALGAAGLGFALTSVVKHSISTAAQFESL